MIDTQIEVYRDGRMFRILDGDICHLDEWDFWSGDFEARFEPYTMDWIKKYTKPGEGYLDIGAWVGPTVLYAASLGAVVHGYEPDPAAFYYLENNVALNEFKNAQVYNAAIATKDPVTLYTRTYPGDSMSSMLGTGAGAVTIPGVSFTQAMYQLEANAPVSLVKMDIEGGESVVLPGNRNLIRYLAEEKIPLMLSFHYDFYVHPEEDFRNIIDVLEPYEQFVYQDGSVIDRKDIPKGFGTVLCL